MLQVLADLILGEPVGEQDGDFQVAIRPRALVRVLSIEVCGDDIRRAGEVTFQGTKSGHAFIVLHPLTARLPGRVRVGHGTVVPAILPGGDSRGLRLTARWG